MSTERLDPDFEALLEYLFRNNGFDFTGYKRSSLMRRVSRRLEQLDGVGGYDEYLDYLQVHPEEFTALFNTILINVTSFFRDAAAWEYMATIVIPRLLEANETEPIRVWSAGCASGEEAYTLAILLAEALGNEAFAGRVKIYATDVDEDALNRARHGVYTDEEVAPVPPELLARHFEPTHDGHHVFSPELRRAVIFGRHDIVQDAPIPRLDILACRNVLMYFTTEVQARILARLHFALKDTGVLFLGRAEMLLTHSNVFTPIELRHRVFRRVPRADPHDRLLVRDQAGNGDGDGHLAGYVRLREIAMDALPVAQLIVDVAGTLTLANDRARALFGLHERDLGRRFHDLELSYRPVELRSRLEEAYRTRRAVEVRGVARHLADGSAQVFDVTVTPLVDGDAGTLGGSIAFIDVTELDTMRIELGRSKQELETAYEELQSANEELETTNEELQSTVEELETTNEELQSANEELETTNEELQSTNGELQAINQELRIRSDELDRVNTFTDSILTGIKRGVVAVGQDMRVELWTGSAEELWGLRAVEVVGQDLMALDIGLPVEDLREMVRRCLDGVATDTAIVVDAVNRRGRAFRCRVECAPLRTNHRGVDGVVLTMESMAV
jgi:two-component system, chemotaxis family, CheB/CheR fusion protein